MSRIDRAGQHVVYTLSEGDAAAVESRRKNEEPRRTHNSAAAGQRCPAFIVRDWGGCVNLRVLLDGHDDYWATSRSEGTDPGQWQAANSWPVIED
jgi:hypothetical protein